MSNQYPHQNTLFVTEKFIKENTQIQDNVEFSNIRPTIRLVQDKHIQSLLGTKLYRKLQEFVFQLSEGSIGEIPTDYKYILDEFIVHIIKHGFMAEATTDLLFKYTNISVNTNSGDNIQPVSLSQIQYLQEKHKGDAQFYQKRLVDYLCYNTDKFPEYLDNIEDDIRPKKKAYSGNIWTKKRGMKDRLIYDEEWTYDLIQNVWKPQV